MKKYLLSLAATMCLFSLPAFSQTATETKDTTRLNLPGDNLDLYAVLDLFQKSKTIEGFEKDLNLEKTGINNLDLDLDKKVDFIKVVTNKKDDDFTFVLQVAVSKKETQDVAVILVSKDKDKKITMQIVGDQDLYGKDYIVELKESKTPSNTPNPGYTGKDPDTVFVEAKTTTVVVEQAPIVQYVYSPAYVPYYPPYYYGYYPPYFAAFTVMAVGMYWGHHAHYHGGYGHYHGNTTVIHNSNNFNNYNNNSRNRSNTVNDNMQRGNYNKGNNASARPSTGAGGGAGGGARPSTQPSTGAGGRSGASPSTQPSKGSGSLGTSGRASTQPSNSNVGGSNNRSSGSSKSSGGYSGGGSSRGSGGFSGGGGSRSGGFGGGGGSRGGGGRGGGGRR